MTFQEAARRLEISPSPSDRLVQEGRTLCIRVGRPGRRGKIVLREDDGRAFIAALEGRGR